MTSAAEPATGGFSILNAEATNLVVAFARACRAAVRASALYPAEHPAVATTLAHLVDAVNQMVQGADVRMGISPDTVTVDGRRLVKLDAAVGELAALLHSHQVGQLAIQPQSTPEEWRRLLALVALPADQTRRRGGLSRIWVGEGQTHLTIRQVNYSLLLLDRIHGDRATWDTIVAQCLEGAAHVCDDWLVNTVMEVLDRPEEVGRLVAAIAERTETTGADSAVIAVGVLQSVAEFVRRSQPEHLEPLLHAMAEALAHLPTDELTSVMAHGRTATQRGQQAFVNSLALRMTDKALAFHVANAVREGRGASPEMREFLRGCAPEAQRRTSVLTLARFMCAESPGSQTTADLEAQIDQLMEAHDERPFVSDAYAAELKEAAARAIDLEHDATDPPEAIAAWSLTVTEDRLRLLDAHLLVDLMQIKRDVREWREMAELALARVSVLLIVGDFSAAAFIVEAIRLQHEDHPSAEIRAAASAVLADLLNADLMRHVASHLDTADGSVTTGAKRFCQAVGPSVVPHLADVLSQEERPRSRQHLAAILTTFGADGRQAVERLMQSSNAGVRRTAVLLLREFGGTDALPKLEAMLHDEDPHVQREAVRAVALLAVEPAYESLQRAIVESSENARLAIAGILWSLPADEAAPLLAYLVARAPQGGVMRPIQERALQRLGTSTAPAVLDALADALRRGSLSAPFRTQALRQRAAESLAAIGTPPAVERLQAAAIGGSWGVRRAARAALGITRHTARPEA